MARGKKLPGRPTGIPPVEMADRFEEGTWYEDDGDGYIASAEKLLGGETTTYRYECLDAEEDEDHVYVWCRTFDEHLEVGEDI